MGKIVIDVEGQVYVPRLDFVPWTVAELDEHAQQMRVTHRPDGRGFRLRWGWPFVEIIRDRRCVACPEVGHRWPCEVVVRAWAWVDQRREGPIDLTPLPALSKEQQP